MTVAMAGRSGFPSSPVVRVTCSSHRQSSTGCVVVTATCATSPLSQITYKTKLVRRHEPWNCMRSGCSLGRTCFVSCRLWMEYVCSSIAKKSSPCHVNALIATWRSHRLSMSSRVLSMWQVYIDNLDVLEVCDWADLQGLTKSGQHEGMIIAGEMQTLPVPRSPGKEVVRGRPT